MRERSDEGGTNSWGEYRRLVLKSLEDLHALCETRARENREDLAQEIASVRESIRAIDERQRADRETLVSLKTKAAVIGFVSGAVVAAIVSAVVALVIK